MENDLGKRTTGPLPRVCTYVASHIHSNYLMKYTPGAGSNSRQQDGQAAGEKKKTRTKKEIEMQLNYGSKLAVSAMVCL